MKKLLLIFGLLIMAASAYSQGAPQGRPVRDSLGVDADGNGSTESYMYVSPGIIGTLKKGTNITMSLASDILTISAAAGSGTTDSLGIDTDGNGTPDAWLNFTASPGVIGFVRAGANVTLTVGNDTLYIAGNAGAGTADSIGFDTDGNAVANGFLYSVSAGKMLVREGTGIDMTILAEDTVSIAATLGTDITSAEIVDQTIDKTDIDSTSSNVVFNDAYEGSSAVADSQYSTRNWTKLEILDSLNEYVLRSGTRAMTANWAYGDFDLTGAERIGGDTGQFNVADINDLDLYTGANSGGAYDSTDIPTNLQQLTWVTGGILRWENQGSGGGGNVFKQGIDPDDGAGAASLIDNDSVVIQGTSTIRVTLDNTAGPVDTIDFAVGNASLLDAKMANDALDADKIVGDATDDDDLDVAAGGTGVSTLTDGGILLGAGSGDITALGAAANGQIPIGDGTTAPVLATISGTANEIDVTNGAGSITIGIVNPLGTGQGGTGVTDPGIWRTKNTSDTIVYVGGDTLLVTSRNNQTVDTVLVRPGGSHFLEVEADRIDISGDLIDDFQGTGLTVATRVLTATLGTDIVTGEIVDQTIAKSDVDSTASNFIFDNAYEGTSAEPDSQYSTRNFVKKEILDSLGEYVLLSGTRAMTGNWAFGDFDLTGAEALEVDTIRNAGDELFIEDRMKVRDIALYTGGNNFAEYDSADAPSNGQQLTWNTGNTLTWEAAGGAGGGDDARADTSGADNVVNLASPFFLEQSTGIDLSASAALDTLYLKTTLGTTIEGSEITDQTIAKTDIDTTASNFPFDDAYHVTTNVADSEYASFRYAQARAGDTAAALRNGDTWTGTHVYTSAVITLPNGVNPTTATEGDISWDTDDDALEVTDGTNDVLIPFQKTISMLIWDPELVTDTIAIFYCDSTIYQGGITLTSFEAQTNVDGAYTLNLYEFDTADPPARVGAGTIAALAFGASDQRDQTTTFSDAGIARGGHVYLLTPATNISWLRVSITFRVNENN